MWWWAAVCTGRRESVTWAHFRCIHTCVRLRERGDPITRGTERAEVPDISYTSVCTSKTSLQEPRARGGLEHDRKRILVEEDLVHGP